jgi:hypothetical protein
MKPIRVGTEDDAEGADDDAEWRPRRRHDRHRLFMPAHLMAGDEVVDCVLVDISPDGAQVCLVAWADLPERVTLLLPNAGTRPMRRRWQQGSFIGFETTGEAVPLS